MHIVLCIFFFNVKNLFFLVLFIKILTCFSLDRFSQKSKKKSFKKLENTTQSEF